MIDLLKLSEKIEKVEWKEILILTINLSILLLDKNKTFSAIKGRS